MLALYSITAALPTIDPIENIENALTQWYQSLADLINIVQQSPTDSVDRIGGMVQNMIACVTQPVGYAIIVLCFFFGIFGTGATMSETKRPEAAVRLFIRTGVAAYFVENGHRLVSLILGISQSLIGDFAGLSYSGMAGEAPKIPDTMKNAIHELSPIGSLGITIVGLVGSLAITVCSFVVLLTVYGRFFKIYMYMIISPIPLGTFAAKNTQQVGIQFLRNYIATTLEGVVMYIAIIVYKFLQAHVTSYTWLNIPDKYDPAVMSANAMVWNYLSVNIFNILILLTIIKASNQLAKEMFGV